MEWFVVQQTAAFDTLWCSGARVGLQDWLYTAAFETL